MTTLLLPADEIAKLRVMKGLAYMLAVMITLDRYYPGRAFRAEQVALVAGMDVRTASKQLQDLSTLDRVILSKGGYVLTQGGRALFLAPANDEALALSPDGSQALKAQALTQSTTSIPAFPQIGKASDLEEGENNTHAARALLKKEEEGDSSLILKTNSTSSTSEIKSAQSLRADGEWPSVREILEATADLFGEPGVLVHGLDLDAIHPWMALAWIAHAWDQWVEGGGHGNLNAPAGVVHNRLKSGQKPRPIYYNSGWDILPDDFMETLGLRSFPCDCGKVFDHRAEYELHVKMLYFCEYHDHGCEERFHSMEKMQEHVKKQHVKAERPMREGLGSDTPGAKAWKEVLSQLQMEMPRASYDAWVQDTQAVQYEGHVLTVCARNAYVRDWLESRLESTVERLCDGILSARVTVRFVVADVGGEGDDD